MRKPSELTDEEARAEAEALRVRREEADRLDAPLFREQSMRGIGERTRQFLDRYPGFLEAGEEDYILKLKPEDE